MNAALDTVEFDRLAKAAREAQQANTEAQTQAAETAKPAREAKGALLAYVEQASGVQRLWL